jgi:hypothetical protein
MKRVYIGALVGLGVMMPLCWIAIMAAGAGHGTYPPARLFFPFTMLISRNGTIGPAAISLIFLQGGVYGAVIAGSPKRRFGVALVICLHLVAVIMAVIQNTDSFWSILRTANSPQLYTPR